MDLSSLLLIQNWYIGKCDDVWEHSYGFKIENLDNPGWVVEITGESEKKEGILQIDRSDEDWIYVKTTSDRFIGRSGAVNLIEMMEAAINWLEVKS